MDELIKQAQESLALHGTQATTLTIWEVVLALLLATVCTVSIALLYRYTHRSVGYSQSYVQTLILTSLVTTLIMIVIGSNIARAFSLVGALSIIRFRNAVKETRDVGYIFFSMAIAMACGTRFYAVAILATILISVVMLTLHLLDFGSRHAQSERILRVHLPPGVDPETALLSIFETLFDAHSLVLLESIRGGLQTSATYSVRPKASTTPAQVLEQIAPHNGNLKVVYNQAANSDEV